MIVLSPNVSVPFCLSFHHFNSHTLLISTLVVDDFNHNDLKVRMCPEDIALMVNIFHFSQSVIFQKLLIIIRKTRWDSMEPQYAQKALALIFFEQ